ncbi:MAG: ABC transporter permease [Nocardiopsaceae bacterium]|nr:ABC transporter permease [Nocardiopsaceae bacterium]
MRATVPAAAGTAGEPAASGSRRLTDRVFRIRESGIIAVLVVFVAVTASIQPRFLSSGNIQFILVNTTVFALLALAETMVVVSRNVDLSIGSVLGLSAYVSAGLFGQVPGISIPVVFLTGLGIGLACGAANGLMVSIGRVPSLVVTLATLYIVRGIDILVVGGNEVIAQTLPDGFTQIPRAGLGGVPYLAIVIAAVIGAGAYYLRSFRSGRELYAIGSNPDAARLAGISVGRRVFTAFTVSGAIAGVAGVLWAAQYQTIDSTAGTGYELQVIAAVVVGGVAIFGGSGSAVGAAVGALLLQTISSALNVLGIPPLWIQAIAGLLLLLAITLDRAISVRLLTSLRVRSSGVGT